MEIIMKLIRKHKFLVLTVINLGLGVLFPGILFYWAVVIVHIGMILLLNYRYSDQLSKMLALDGILILSSQFAGWREYYHWLAAQTVVDVGASIFQLFILAFLGIDLILVGIMYLWWLVRRKPPENKR